MLEESCDIFYIKFVKQTLKNEKKQVCLTNN